MELLTGAKMTLKEFKSTDFFKNESYKDSRIGDDFLVCDSNPLSHSYLKQKKENDIYWNKIMEKRNGKNSWYIGK